MDTINRLQFRHHSDVFTAPTLDKARSAAKKYIYEDIWRNEVLEGDEPHYGRSLLAEPTILRYAIDGEEPHIMFCIGADTNEDGWTNDYNKFCIIDIDKTEAEIEDLGQALEDAIKSLTVTALSSTTLNMFAEKTDDGTFISGEVKVAESTIFPEEGIVRKNDLRIVTNPTGDKKYEGLFIYIDLNYDEEKEEFTFKVNDESGTTVPLLNHYVTGGTYHIEDQSIWLDIKDIDEPVKIDCTNLIDEWTVDEGTKTPVILTKTEVKMDSPDYVHHKPNQDILSADIRIKDETINPITKQYEKLATSSNILNRTSDGRCLYVDGKASNIIYYKDGEKTSVKSVLDELTKLKLSNDSNNIIVNKVDGFFASSKLEYISNENKLIFKVSSLNDNGQIVDKKTEIELNTVEVFKYIYYDTVTEELVLTYTDDKGEEKIVRIPIGQMIDEWDVFNEGHNIRLYKNRDVAGKDKLSADAKIATTAAHNILEDRNHELYVRGEADNIKYDATGATTVKNVLDTLSGKIDTEIARSESADTKHDNEIAELSANTQASLKTISADSSINVEIGDIAYPQVGKKADIKVNLSSQSGNTIRLLEDGLFNFIDLKTENYSGGTKIILYYSDSTQSTGVNTREAVVDNISFIDSITYDPSDETLVIVYYSGTTRKEERIPLRGLINEWKPADDNDNQAIKLRRVSAVTGSDILYASATTSPKDDNILVIDYENNALYVSNSGITKNAYDINHEIQRATSAETALRNDLTSEITRSTTKDNEHDTAITRIDNTIGTGFTTGETVTRRFNELSGAISTEIARATSEEQRIEAKLDHEITDRIADVNEEEARAKAEELILTNKIGTGFTDAFDNNVTAKFNALSGALNTEIQDRINDVNAEETRATGVENQLRTDLIAETTRATSAETTLHNEIVTETNRAISAETTLNTKLDNEISRLVAKDYEHDAKISANTTAIATEVTRATNAENDLDDKITAEKNRAQSAETALNTAIDTERTRATTAENDLDDKITAEKNRAQSAETALNTAIDTERTRATTAESALTSNLNDEITRSVTKDNQLQSDLVTEVTRSTNYDNALSGALTTEVTNRTAADTVLETKINNEVTRATNAETALQTALTTEVTNRTDEDSRLNSLITAETAAREAAIDSLSDQIGDITYSVDDTATVDMTLNNKVITSNVKIGTGNTIMFVDNSAGGIRADVNLTYDGGRNVLVFEKTNPTGGTTSKELTLNAGSIIDSITYDNSSRELVIRYHTSSSAEAKETRVNVSALFNEWECSSNHNGGVVLTKSTGTGTAGADVLSAEVRISTNSKNILVNDGGTLYVDGSGIVSASTTAECAKNELNTLENIIGVNIPDCSTSQTYSPNGGTRYISAATSFNNADVILDGAIKGVANELATEITNRINGDTALQTNINNEIDNRTSEDNRLNNLITAETQNRINGDTTLQTNIDNEESARIASDTALNTAITNEVTNRISADTVLSGAITSEASTRASVDTALQTSIDGIKNSTLTITKNGTSMGTFNPGVSNTIEIPITVPTKISDLSNDLKNLTWSLGAPSADTTGYNGSASKSITIPSTINHIGGIKDLTIKKNGTTVGTYNPTSNSTIDITVPTSLTSFTNDLKTLTWSLGNPTADTVGFNGSSQKNITIPKAVKNLDEWDSTNSKYVFGNNVDVTGALNVTGSITCQSAIYSSDVNLKENINNADINKKIAARKVEIKEFNFKDNPNKDKVYGIIAQEVEEQGLNEIVFTKEDGYKAVDYTSLMMLKIGYLENENEALKNTIMDLKVRLENLENKQ